MSIAATPGRHDPLKMLLLAIAPLAFHGPCIQYRGEHQSGADSLAGRHVRAVMNQISPAPKIAVNIQCDGIDESVRIRIVAQAASTSPKALAPRSVADVLADLEAEPDERAEDEPVERAPDELGARVRSSRTPAPLASSSLTGAASAAPQS